MLAKCEECGETFEAPEGAGMSCPHCAMTTGPGLVPEPARPATDVAAGGLIGPYRIERELGRGNMGVVFLARRSDGVRVALKVATRAVMGVGRARFVREARAAARLDHPAIVRALDAGDSPRGPWIAMELVDGTPLSLVARRLPLPLPRALDLVEQIARAMDHAHRRGVVHRDLKPANVLVGRDGRVRVADFGVARDLEDGRSLTARGDVLGTPAYMAPEQARGEVDAVGAASDIHAIGAILYELVTGTPPFGRAKNVLVAVMTSTLEPPSARCPELALPRDLDAIVLRALAKKPGERYLAAIELAQDLDALRRGERPRFAYEAPAARDPAFALAPGSVVGGYELLYPVGRGGSAVVFKARAKDGSFAALKVIRAPETEQLDRFDREVRLLRLLTSESPGFVPLLDHGIDWAGPWLAMAFVAGGTLRDKLERGPRSLDESLACVRAIAATVALAHKHGIAHRDLKPENILFGDDGTPLVADLGIARHFTRDLPGGTDSTTVTVSRDGKFVGTAGYASPEQLGDARSAGPPADVFALAAILYECLSGTPPFVLGSDGLVAAARRLARAEHEPLRKVLPAVPRWIDDLVEKALEADPRRRYKDAGELARALEGP